MNPRLQALKPYPFERLAKLKEGISPPPRTKPLSLAVGEPQHAIPNFIQDVIENNLAGLCHYPATTGSIELRTTIAEWLHQRFKLPHGLLDPDQHILPVNGTREALFSIVQCLINQTDKAKTPPLVLMPNPFYQIYEGAAYLAGAQPYFINASAANNWQPDYESVPEHIWQQCQLLFICSPGNPTGAVLEHRTMARLLSLAQQYNFIIASDECYSEIYFREDAAPPGLLEVCAQMGNEQFKQTLVFHSLSKRSNLPGMRSGFVAGDTAIIEQYRLYRTYHGCAMSPTFQAVSIAAWKDETHVRANRELYRQKLTAVLKILAAVMPAQAPDAGFYLWAPVPGTDEEFTRGLFERYNLTVLPGSYLSRTAHGVNPGANHIRMALVPSLEDTIEAAERISSYISEIR